MVDAARELTEAFETAIAVMTIGALVIKQRARHELAARSRPWAR